jgi:hypothetical protein
MQTYEADHKEDGPFLFEHCWEFLKKEPKWDAYLERLEDLEPEKRKFTVDDEVRQHFNLDVMVLCATQFVSYLSSRACLPMIIFVMST